MALVIDPVFQGIKNFQQGFFFFQFKIEFVSIDKNRNALPALLIVIAKIIKSAGLPLH